MKDFKSNMGFLNIPELILPTQFSSVSLTKESSFLHWEYLYGNAVVPVINMLTLLFVSHALGAEIGMFSTW